MIELEQSNLPQSECHPKPSAIFILPAYPFPQESVGYSLSGLVERLAGLPKKSHPAGILFDTRLRVDAAIFMANKADSTIVTMSRKIRSWMNYSYSELMANHFKSLTSKEIRIIEEDESFDLITELSQIKTISEKQGFVNVTIMTDSQQIGRVKDIIASQTGFPQHNTVTMEEILTDEKYANQRTHQFKKIIDKLHQSNYWKFWKLREGISRKLPYLANKLSQITR